MPRAQPQAAVATVTEEEVELSDHSSVASEMWSVGSENEHENDVQEEDWLIAPGVEPEVTMSDEEDSQSDTEMESPPMEPEVSDEEEEQSTQWDIREEQRKWLPSSQFTDVMAHLTERKATPKGVVQADGFALKDGILYRVLKQKQKASIARCHAVVVPPTMRTAVLQMYHDDVTSGHFGWWKTWSAMASKVWWPNMQVDVKQFVSSCEVCQTMKSRFTKTQGKLQPIVADKPFQIVSIDFVGHLPKSERGNSVLITLTDLFTKYMELSALPAETAELAAEAVVNKIVLRHGAPEVLLSDNGKQFTGNLMKAITRHPQANGQAERTNQIAIRLIRTFCKDHQKDWDQHLDAIAFAINTARQASTGVSPFFAVYHREAVMPQDILLKVDAGIEPVTSKLAFRDRLVADVDELYELMRNSSAAAKEKQKRFFDEHRAVGAQYKVGDRVLLKRGKGKKGAATKLLPR
eukprot:TRINITY_DN1524_c0_g1_i2.p2 TRINITY_DN1524_c0_g1~~TRINITY_DN1524_c0_g1_i2.p2  ORF type:complete len:464 (+),score=84.75 TRINITY_DN1524_c0_g1_i2:2936-4327(+)